ncbi:MAG: YihY/virulence factor BrkB family protein [Acidimicrobiia bacterium]
MIEQIIARLPAWARAPAETLAGAAAEFGNDRASRMAAAIAYRTVFAVAPLLMVLVAVLGAFLGSRAEAQLEIRDSIEAVAGREVADIVGSVITSATVSANTTAILGGVLLLWTASGLFLEMQRNLNDIFEAPAERLTGIVAMIRTRGIGFLWTLGLGILLVVTWGLNAIWRFLGTLLPDSMASLHEVVVILTPLLSLVLLPLVFALIFRTMVAITVAWRAVWVGGLFTSVIFLLAAYGIGVFFQVADPTTALGFTGAFVVVLFLAYFLSMVFLFGAEVTKVYADRLAARSTPAARQPLYGDGQVVVAEPPAGFPRAAFMAFLAGLLVGWRRSRR